MQYRIFPVFKTVLVRVSIPLCTRLQKFLMEKPEKYGRICTGFIGFEL